jgi:hypothetical protein
MGTIATMGQAIGTAASICNRSGLLPRDLDAGLIRELQQRLMRDDSFLVGRANGDSSDLARTARITATSDLPLECTKGEEWKPLADGCGQIFPVTAGRLDVVEIFLNNGSGEPAEVTLALSSCRHLYDFGSGHPLAESSAVLPPDSEGWVRFPFHADLPRGLYRICASFAEGVSWRRATGIEPHGTKTGEWDKASGTWSAYRGYHRVDTATWHPFRGCFNFRVTPASRPHTPDQAVNGYTRPLDWPNAWVSEGAFPQSLTLEFPAPVALGEILLTFDTDLDHRIPPRFCPQCVRDYVLHIHTEAGWETLATVKGNYQRRRSHDAKAAKAAKADAIRIEVLSTNGDPSARIFEVRAYPAP